MSTRATATPPPFRVARLRPPAALPQSRQCDHGNQNCTERHPGDPVRKKIANRKRVRRRHTAPRVSDDPTDEHTDHPPAKKTRDQGDAPDSNIGPNGWFGVTPGVIRHASYRGAHVFSRSVRGQSAADVD